MSRNPNGIRAAASGEAEGSEDLALRMVAGIGGAGRYAFVAILESSNGTGLAPVAYYTPAHGARLGSGQALPEPLGSYLRERALVGPWVEDARGLSATFGHLGPFGEARLGIVATTPLLAGDGVLGVLVVGLASEDTTADPGDFLDAVTRFGHVVSATLGPRLGDSSGRATGYQRIEEIVKTSAFTTVFQPIVELEGRGTVGYEALTRFADGVTPDRRFLEAQRVGAGQLLEEATMTAAVRAASGLPTGRWVSINASPALLERSDAPRALLSGTDRPFVIELTEHLPIADYATLRAALDRLDGSVRLAIDDAGAGFASMRHVLELRPAFVKLDLTLTRGIDGDRVRQALVAGLRHFAGRAGCELIAEGVEREAEVAALRVLGARLGQGFLFARPMPAAALE